jgi:phage terminase large subunit
MIFLRTTATEKLLRLKKRIRAISGGTSASKTISILMILIDYGQNASNEVITVVGESFPHLNLGAIRDFKNIMVAHGYWNDKNWNETSHTYKFDSGTLIEFISFDKYGKAHGPRRDVLFLNEANNIPYKIADQLITRTRNHVWLDWNPTVEFWFHTDMFGKRDDIDYMGDGGTLPPLTYLDNEALDEPSKKEIETHKWNAIWWRVYGLGLLGELEGKIYKGWKMITEIPHEARLERYGLDFGYSNDPTVIIAIYSYNGGYILDEVLYQKGMKNKEIADVLKNMDPAIVVADNSEPKSIDEIREFGISIIPCVKGQGSVNRGIDYVQSQRISLTDRSVKTWKAYRNYMWTTDKDGNIINTPDDTVHEWSNSMDAVRYGMESLKGQVGEIYFPPMQGFGGERIEGFQL